MRTQQPSKNKALRTFLRAAIVVLGALTLAPSFQASAQDDGLVRGYENIQKIKPDDFQGTPDPNSTYDAETKSYVEVKKVDVPHELAAGQQVTIGGTKYWRFPVKSMEWKGVVFETVFSKTDSWWRDKSKDGDLLQHERGHIDITEVLTRQVNALEKKIVEEVKKLGAVGNVYIKDTGQTEAEAKKAAEKQFEETMANDAKSAMLKVAKNEVDAWKKRQGTADKEGTYDTETDHGRDTKAQKEWKRKFAALLEPKPKKPQAKSESKESVHFDSGTNILSFDNDVITGIDGSNLDFISGAEVIIPDFLLIGETSWHDIFFQAQGDPTVTIMKDSTILYQAELPYMIYFDNTFLGIMPHVSPFGVGSDFIEELRLSYESGDPFLMGLSIVPDQDFTVLSNNFTADASSGFTNLIGETQPVPQPSSLLLLAGGLVMVVVARRTLPTAPRTWCPRVPPAGKRGLPREADPSIP